MERTKLGTFKKEDIILYTLTNKKKTKVSILNFGATLKEFSVLTKSKRINLIVGFKNISDYYHDGFQIGKAIGPVAGRISNARFKLNNHNYFIDQNDGKNSLHGGYNGFNTLLFKEKKLLKKENGEKLTLSTIIPESLDHYPGRLQLQIDFDLLDDNTLTISFTGLSSKDTLFNPTSHVYWKFDDNLKNALLQIHSDKVVITNNEKIPVGNFFNVSQTPFDFNKLTSLENSLIDLKNKYDLTNFDDAFVIDNKDKKTPIATLKNISELYSIDFFSNRNGLILFTANPTEPIKNINRNYNAVAIEPQTLPDAINQTNFGNIVLRKGIKETQSIKFKINNF